MPSKQLWQLCASAWKSEIAFNAWLMIARLVMANLYLETENKFHIIEKKKENIKLISLQKPRIYSNLVKKNFNCPRLLTN